MASLKNGFCCICGEYGPLSFEHVPPASAYNKEKYTEHLLLDRLEKKGSKGIIKQGGIGSYTLCMKCNNNTGSWYGGEYVKWAHIGQSIAESPLRHEKSVHLVLQKVYPLRFLKQVITCFFSVAGEPSGSLFARNNPELTNFILDRECKNLSEKYRFFMNLYKRSQSTILRRYPIAAKLNVTFSPGKGIQVNNACVLSEYTHPPFQFVMTEGDLFQGSLEISNLKQYGYDEQVDLDLQLQVIDSTNIYPGNLA